MDKALFSSRSDLWGTPPDLFALLNNCYEFRLDAAASPFNALCDHYFTETEDSLKQVWHPYRRVWLNPPYGRMVGSFMRKAYEESQLGCIVVCLVPARVDTRWWHDWVYQKGFVEYIKGRLTYLDHSNGGMVRKNSAPFPSAIVTYVPHSSTRFSYRDCPSIGCNVSGACSRK